MSGISWRVIQYVLEISSAEPENYPRQFLRLAVGVETYASGSSRDAYAPAFDSKFRMFEQETIPLMEIKI